MWVSDELLFFIFEKYSYPSNGILLNLSLWWDNFCSNLFIHLSMLKTIVNSYWNIYFLSLCCGCYNLWFFLETYQSNLIAIITSAEEFQVPYCFTIIVSNYALIYLCSINFTFFRILSQGNLRLCYSKIGLITWETQGVVVLVKQMCISFADLVFARHPCSLFRNKKFMLDEMF